MTYLIQKNSKKRLVGYFVTLLSSLVLSGCGSVVKNPTRPQPTPAQSESFANLLSGMVAEVLELLSAAEASLKSSKPKVGFECSESSDGANILFKGSSQYTESLNSIAGLRSYALNDSQEHTHKWLAAAADAAKPTCDPDKGLSQSVLDLNGLKLSYEFKQATTIVTDSLSVQTSSSGKRDLTFAETPSSDDLKKSYLLDVESQTNRSIGPEAFDLKLADNTTVFTYERSTSTWTQKEFAGVFESTFESKAQAVSFEGATVIKNDRANCFPSSGLLSGVMDASDGVSFSFKVDFANTGIPLLQFDGVEEKTELKVLNCIK